MDILGRSKPIGMHWNIYLVVSRVLRSRERDVGDV